MLLCKLTTIVVEVQVSRGLIPRRPGQAGIGLLEPVPHPGTSLRPVPGCNFKTVSCAKQSFECSCRARLTALGSWGSISGEKGVRTRHSAATPAARCPGMSTAWVAS